MLFVTGDTNGMLLALPFADLRAFLESLQQISSLVALMNKSSIIKLFVVAPAFPAAASIPWF